MKNLTLKEFLKYADDYIDNAAIGDSYSIQTKSGKAILISQREWDTIVGNRKENEEMQRG